MTQPEATIPPTDPVAPAPARRPGARPPPRAWSDILHAEPWRFSYLALMRELERSARDKPPIGRSQVMAQEIATPVQPPFMAFPSCNVVAAEWNAGAPVRVEVQFLGFFGPQGALPLSTTVEAYQWKVFRNDPAFAEFANVLATRFLQLFYRAWADARPIVQLDRPEHDRFRAWLGSFIGLGTPALRDRDDIPDIVKLRFVGLLGSRVRSAARLVQIMREMLGLNVELHERVGTWLEFEPGDRSALGGPRAVLGQTTVLGSRSFSVNDKVRLIIHTDTLEEYGRFLPGGSYFEVVAGFLHFYLGQTTEIEVGLTLPVSKLPATKLGTAGQLGWTSFVPAETAGDGAGDTDEGRRVCAVLSAEHLKQSKIERAA